MRGITLFAPSILLPLVADYFQWRGIWCTYAAPYAQKSLSLTSRFAVVHTTRNGDAVDDRGYIDPIRNGHAFETTGCIDPFVRWKGHAGKVLQLYQVGGMKAWCLANLSTQKKHPASWPALGQDSTYVIHIVGCFATCRTITEAPSRCILLFYRTGRPQLP